MHGGLYNTIRSEAGIIAKLSLTNFQVSFLVLVTCNPKRDNSRLFDTAALVGRSTARLLGVWNWKKNDDILGLRPGPALGYIVFRSHRD